MRDYVSLKIGGSNKLRAKTRTLAHLMGAGWGEGLVYLRANVFLRIDLICSDRLKNPLKPQPRGTSGGPGGHG